MSGVQNLQNSESKTNPCAIDILILMKQINSFLNALTDEQKEEEEEIL